jgi:hypothetical protein
MIPEGVTFSALTLGFLGAGASLVRHRKRHLNEFPRTLTGSWAQMR